MINAGCRFVDVWLLTVALVVEACAVRNSLIAADFGRNLIANGNASQQSLTKWVQSTTRSCAVGTPATCQTGDYFTGPRGALVVGFFSCRMNQTIPINQYALKYVRAGAVNVTATGILGRQDDNATFIVAQYSTNGVLLCSRSAMPANKECSVPFRLSHPVSPSTSYFIVSFYCSMTIEGIHCDGWGNNFSLLLNVTNPTLQLRWSNSVTVTQSNSKNAFAARLTSTWSFSDAMSRTLSLTTAHRTATRTPTEKQSRSPTVLLLPSPVTHAITPITQGITAGVASTAALLSATAVSGALMQASLGAAPCAVSTNSNEERNANPSMYFISPFYSVGNVAVVFGNIGLVATFAAAHFTVAVAAVKLATPAGDGGDSRSWLTAFVQCRFPNFSLHAAVYAVQGVTLGGWALLWDVINPADEREGGGAVAGKVLAWIAAHVYAAAVLWALWRVRMSLLSSDGRAVTFFGRLENCCARAQGAAKSDSDVQHIDSEELLVPQPIPAEVLPSAKLLGALSPMVFWRPRRHRLMFGAAFITYGESSLLWLVGDVAVLPIIVSVASTTKPSAAVRSAACNSVMMAAAALLFLYSGALAYARPYRVGARNLLSPFVAVWMGLTCVLSCPLVSDSVGAANVEEARGVVSAAQSLTVLSLVVADLMVLFTVDRRMAKGEAAATAHQCGHHLNDGLELEVAFLPIFTDDTIAVVGLATSTPPLSEITSPLESTALNEGEWSDVFLPVTVDNDVKDSELSGFRKIETTELEMMYEAVKPATS